ncbi:hypothetical protein GCM10015535_45820 [Streptomyces gelaticus]|uniref:Uncharacterized protein n=1 Tax=Streptomyces gelaticus TaxID=285446 RepID=A0ABQ2W2M0_9ACTN|nr:hypothetical protein GCM10015535_45820 [Streptomyces gelaticus]
MDLQGSREAGSLARNTAFPHCNSKRIANQLDDHHQKKYDMKDNTPVRSDPGSDKRSSGTLTAA